MGQANTLGPIIFGPKFIEFTEAHYYLQKTKKENNIQASAVGVRSPSGGRAEPHRATRWSHGGSLRVTIRPRWPRYLDRAFSTVFFALVRCPGRQICAPEAPTGARGQNVAV
ncbi:hypothetical protein SLEP1_g6884 [Rubroshorea leprosula]|uniref:Uncharacterized protein n=1 Tax=Rubroshorea leprosula TaxID=152421 RepID=A0AAV5I7G6_9ROSI|nr:hypothetical protein SLEP1_g6884 [Rubroshorea leprosula]